MPTDHDLTELLVTAPRLAVDPELFSSNTRFGKPGIFPQGREMVPAAGPSIG